MPAFGKTGFGYKRSVDESGFQTKEEEEEEVNYWIYIERKM